MVIKINFLTGKKIFSSLISFCSVQKMVKEAKWADYKNKAETPPHQNI